MLVKFFQLKLSHINLSMHNKLGSKYHVVEKSLLDLNYLHFSIIVVYFNVLCRFGGCLDKLSRQANNWYWALNW